MSNFIQFALNLGLNKKQIAGVLNRFNGSIDDVQNLIKSSFLSEEMQRLYIEVFFDRIKIITK